MDVMGTGRVLFLQHQADCPPGLVGEQVLRRGRQVEIARSDGPSLPDPRRFDLVVSLGSYRSAYDDSAPVRREYDLLTAAVDADVPVFGICFGAQLLSRVLGGDVRPAPEGPEIGWLDVDPTPSAAGLVEPGPWLVWHLDVMTAPPGGVELATTPVGVQAFAHGAHLGVQFHLEAMAEGVLAWTRHYRGLLGELGVDPDKLVVRARELAVGAARRAYALTDRVLDAAAGRRHLINRLCEVGR